MRVSAVFLAFALAGTAAPMPAQDAPIPVTIRTNRPGVTVDRDIFGQFAEHLGAWIYAGVWVEPDSAIPNVRGIRSDGVAALRPIKVPNVRWPGGCFVDEYHWRNGVGPASQRRSTVNANGGGAIEPNTFGTDEFMDFVGQIDSEAYISINVGSGTFKEASERLAYMTANQRSSAGADRAANGHPEPYKVKFLGFGNENWDCGGDMRPEHYIDLMKRYARFTRNYNAAQQGEETMQRIAVGPSDGT